MLHAPEKYLNAILSKVGTNKDISLLHLNFIDSCTKNLHFIIDEKELNFELILSKICLKLNDTNKTFDFKPGQRLAHLKNPKLNYSPSALKAYHSPYIIKSINAHFELEPSYRAQTLDKFIPISNYRIERAGNLINRISSFQSIRITA